ncbi:MAG TPA: SAM-dependent methyltransferase [Candidatus Binatia bacterium]|nr:SAM-dependent methyltransferase [Candidatus Binatia bacterium]
MKKTGQPMGQGFLLFLLVLSAGCATSSVDYQAVLTNTQRPDAERKLDAVRKPQEVMAFYGVKRGDKVADLFAARGYYTAILSQLVGPEGIVYSANAVPRAELHERVKQSNLTNVRVIDGPFDKVALPQDGSLDFVFIHLDYHELAADTRAAMNRRVFAALKKGGTYGVVDHSAAAGRGDQDAKTFHRIEKALVIKDATAAGFRLAEEGNMLARPDDTKDFSVTKLRDRSDRFVLKFVKP